MRIMALVKITINPGLSIHANDVALTGPAP
jgi:hypothetical protein